ncbi:MAG: hypothetical protein ACJ76Z_11405 [Thermoleophilaceae bacterium]
MNGLSAARLGVELEAAAHKRDTLRHRRGPSLPTRRPDRVLGSTSAFVPQALDRTFEFTPTGGTTQSEPNTASKGNVHGDLVTCTFDATFPVPGGTAHIFGSVVGFFTPAS